MEMAPTADPSTASTTSSKRREMRKRMKEQLKNFVRFDIQRRQRRFYQAPIIRQFWGVDQQEIETNWAELFFDLIYVAVAFKLGDQIAEDIEAGEFGKMLLFFFGQYCPLFYAWFTRMIYFSRFETISLFHRMRDVLEALLVALMALFIGTSSQVIFGAGDNDSADELSNESKNIGMLGEISDDLIGSSPSLLFGTMKLFLAEEADGNLIDANILFGLTMCFLMFHLLYFFEYWEVKAVTGRTTYSEKDRNAINSSAWNNMIASTSPLVLAIAASVASFYGEVEIALGILILSFVSGIIVFSLMLSCRPRNNPGLPINVRFVIDRLGEFTMLMLGEGVLQIIITAINDEDLVGHLSSFALAFIILSALQYLDFFVIPFEPDEHGFRKSRYSAHYLIVTAPLNYGSLIFTGVALKNVLKKLDKFSKPEGLPFQWHLCISMAATCVLLILQGFVHVGVYDIVFKKPIKKTIATCAKECVGISNVNWPRVCFCLIYLCSPLLFLVLPDRKLEAPIMLFLIFIILVVIIYIAMIEKKLFRSEEEQNEIEEDEALFDDFTEDSIIAEKKDENFGRKILKAIEIEEELDEKKSKNEEDEETEKYYSKLCKEIHFEKRKISTMLDYLRIRTSLVADRVESTETLKCKAEDADQLREHAGEMLELSQAIYDHVKKITPQCAILREKMMKKEG